MRGIGFPDATSAVKSFGFPVPRLRVGLSSEITVRPGPSYRELDVVLVTDAGDDLVCKLCVVSVFTLDLQRAVRADDLLDAAAELNARHWQSLDRTTAGPIKDSAVRAVASIGKRNVHPPKPVLPLLARMTDCERCPGSRSKPCSTTAFVLLRWHRTAWQHGLYGGRVSARCERRRGRPRRPRGPDSQGARQSAPRPRRRWLRGGRRCQDHGLRCDERRCRPRNCVGARGGGLWERWTAEHPARHHGPRLARAAG